MADSIISLFALLISSGSLIAAIIHRIILNKLNKKNYTKIKVDDLEIKGDSANSEDIAKVLRKLIEMNQNIQVLNEKVTQLEAGRSSNIESK